MKGFAKRGGSLALRTFLRSQLSAKLTKAFEVWRRAGGERAHVTRSDKGRGQEREQHLQDQLQLLRDQLQQQQQQLQGHFGNFSENVWPHLAWPNAAFSKLKRLSA